MMSGIMLSLLTISFHGCGESNTQQAKIDLAEYYNPQADTVQNRVALFYNQDAEIEHEKYYESQIRVEGNRTTYEVNTTVEIISIVNKEDINTSYPNQANWNVNTQRYATLGDEVSFSYGYELREINGQVAKKIEENRCVLASKITEFEGDSSTLKITYTGDILVQKCTNMIEVSRGDLNVTRQHVDVEYFYFKKDVGQIAQVNRTCWIDTGHKEADGSAIYVANDYNTSCDSTELFMDLLLE